MTTEVTVSLSHKEKQILSHLIIEGKTIQQTAISVFVSERRVTAILENIKDKCGIQTKSRDPLIYFLTKNNLI